MDPETPDNPEEGVDLSWIPENFRRDSVEDSLRAALDSQKEAQRKITELSTQNKGLEESFSSLSSQFEDFVAAQNAPDPNDVRQQWEQAYMDDPWGTIQQVVEHTTKAAEERLSKQSQQPQTNPDIVAFMANQNLASKYADWDQYRQAASELAGNDPLFARNDLWSDPAMATRALDSAYQMVKAQDVLSGNAIAEQQLADTRQMKLAAQSASGGAGRPGSPDDNVQRWSEIMNAKNDKLDL